MAQRIKPMDHLEGRRKEPFEVETNDGEVFKFADPKAMKYRDIEKMNAASQDEQLRLIVGDEAFERLSAKDEVDGYWLEYTMECWRLHFGLGTPGESQASST